VDFIDSIGLNIHAAQITDDTFLPGVTVRKNTIVYDPSRLEFPGDLLHEAGHMAVLSPEQRAAIDGDFGNRGGWEMAAIAWSYAASRYLNLPVDCVFHDGGYRGDAARLRQSFCEGDTVGVPLLEWRGLCTTRGTTRYPAMQSWLCLE
jgi:hypothetical protein